MQTFILLKTNYQFFSSSSGSGPRWPKHVTRAIKAAPIRAGSFLVEFINDLFAEVMFTFNNAVSRFNTVKMTKWKEK
jgi:hypothetical protein